MPRLRKEALLKRVVAGIHQSGWNLIYISLEHPFVLRIYQGDESYQVRIYIWNLTHGGGSQRPADEYRIQITGIDGEIGFVRSGVDKTLILGWWSEADVFAAFDVGKHLGSLGSSPSFQIREDALRRASINGLATINKGNQEIAVGFRSDFLVDYIRDLEDLHDFGKSEEDRTLLEEVIEASGEVNDAAILNTNSERKAILTTVSKQLRDNSFRNRVLVAYSQRCAFCAIQLRLIDAAHIVPASQVNDDSTSNGIALCALHHRAFDRGLVTLNEDYRIVMNEARVEEMKQLSLDGGSKQFERNLLRIANLPPARSDRPTKHLINQANAFRGWDFLAA